MDLFFIKPFNTIFTRCICASVRPFFLYIQKCLDDVDCSPLQSRNELLKREVSSFRFFGQDESQGLTNCRAFANDTNQLPGLEHLSASDTSLNKSASRIEYFSKVNLYECLEKQPEDCLAYEQTVHCVHKDPSFINENRVTSEHAEESVSFSVATESLNDNLQDAGKCLETPLSLQNERPMSKQQTERASDISGPEKTTTDDLPTGNDDDKENKINFSEENGHQGNMNVDGSLG